MESEWDGDLPDVHVREVETQHAVSPEEGAVAWTEAVIALGDLTEACRSLSKTAPDGVAHVLQNLRHDSALAMIAHLQDIRRDLAQTEAYLIRQVGMDDTFREREGVLPDGRHYVVRRGANRKAWDHNLWRRDVREQVLSGVSPELHDPATGEVVDVPSLLAAVQDVHGAGAPKVTALKRLGLDVDDYCETFPGPWALQVTGATPEEEG